MALDCPKAGPLLLVKLGSTEMMFDLPDPSAVEVSSSAKNELDLRCGLLRPFPIAVDYATPGVSSPKSSGVIRKMTFLIGCTNPASWGVSLVAALLDSDLWPSPMDTS